MDNALIMLGRASDSPPPPPPPLLQHRLATRHTKITEFLAHHTQAEPS